MLSRPFRTNASRCFWSVFEDSRQHGAEHETPLSTQQPAPQAGPRLSRPHGHEGRSSRAEPTPREGPQAPRGLTVPPSPADRPLAARRFPRASRLTDKPQFDLVHRQGQRFADALFLVIIRPNAAGAARLGLAVGIKAAGNAVQRNRLKRIARESFREHASVLPAVDIVINARAAAAKAANAALRASLAAHWQRIAEKCARS
jgi:ribonuclease P protein component